jgi:hypothetical protein
MTKGGCLAMTKEGVPRNDEKEVASQRREGGERGPRNGMTRRGLLKWQKGGNDDSKDEKGGCLEVTGRQKGRQ